MHVIQTVSRLGEDHGGPSRTITGLANGLGRCGIGVTVVAGYVARADGVLVCPDANFARLKLVRAWQLGRVRVDPRFRDSVRRLARAASPDVLIHDNGIWGHSNLCAWQASCDAKAPYLLSPRGMIEPWAMQHKLWKKRVALALYQGRILLGAKLLVATAESEYESIRTFGLKQPIAIVPNGIPGLPSNSPSIRQGLRKAGEPRTALFLSRIHAKKGLINLLNAWAQIAPVGWRLKIAGPDEEGHLREVQTTIEHLGLTPSVEYVGSVSGEPKSLLYATADIFVLPTFSENFGLVVAEALAYGVPVITTKGTPWRDLETYRCGWWIDIGVEPLVSALREAMGLPDHERQAMGARGREYVQRYDWDDIAQEMIGVYRWVLGQGDRPGCVRLD